MDQNLQAKVGKGIRKIQKLWGEMLTLGPATLGVAQNQIPFIGGRQSLTQRFVEGKGMEEIYTLAVSVAQGDLSGAPFIGMQAQARSRSWKVWLVNPTQTTWELTLESPNK